MNSVREGPSRLLKLLYSSHQQTDQIFGESRTGSVGKGNSFGAEDLNAGVFKSFQANSNSRSFKPAGKRLNNDGFHNLILPKNVTQHQKSGHQPAEDRR